MRQFPKHKQIHCAQCGRTMSRRDREQEDGTRCYYCCHNKARPPSGDMPFHEVERKLMEMEANELLMPWERPAKRR